jgi:protein-disulfide isomerase
LSKKHRQAVKDAKRKRRDARKPKRSAPWVPFVGVTAVAALIIGALFVVSLGGNGDDAEASYPDGYEPPTDGDPDAPVEVVIWGDFQCTSCQRFETQVLPRIRQEYIETGEVKFVWRNFEHYGAESQDAARAAHCAGEQDDFWTYHDLLYRNQRGINAGAFSRDNLVGFAEDLGLNVGIFGTCLDSIHYDAVLAADKKAGIGEGVTGTPGFHLNGELLFGGQSYETFVSLIENALAGAES